jgi:transcriptional regulator with GAF, ATPase, and Fis domain
MVDGGTLFLDEIGDMPVELQPKLLRVLQEREFERLGSAKTVRGNVRLVAAINQDLSQLVTKKLFRADLFCPVERNSNLPASVA